MRSHDQSKVTSPSSRSRASSNYVQPRVTYVRKEEGPTNGYIDVMVTPYADPLTVDDLEEMRFTPNGERRDEQPGHWGKFAALLLNPQNQRRWDRMIVNMKNLRRKKTGYYVARVDDESSFWKSKAKKARRKMTRYETKESSLSKRASRRPLDIRSDAPSYHDSS